MSEIPGALQHSPSLDLWLRIDARETVTIRTGKVEMGQGILAELTLIAAEELDLHPARVHIAAAVTGLSPNEMLTAGSMSVTDSGTALRQACAHARRIMLDRAAAELGVECATLSVDDGEIGAAGANRALSYWDVQGGRPFGVNIETWIDEKPAGQFRVVGKRMARLACAIGGRCTLGQGRAARRTVDPVQPQPGH